jgi:DNA-binding response OmpR family regulator
MEYSMLEIANSLNVISTDQGRIDYDESRVREGLGGDGTARGGAALCIVLMNEGGAPHGRLGEQLAGLGFEPVYVPATLAGVAELDKRGAAGRAILLDWRYEGPKNAGFAEALAAKAALAGVPVMTLTAADRADDARLAWEAGLGTVLSTPCRLADLKGALDKLARGPAREDSGDDLGLSGATALLESCKFRFRNPRDIERLVPVIAALLPHPRRSVAGLAELMMNAIEHGNLEIGHELKAEWIARGVYQAELVKRLRTPPYSSRWAELIVNRREDGLMIVIMDEGCGFCWQNLIGEEPRPAAEACGNGLAKAQRDSFDELRFNHIGNQVTAFVATGSPESIS